MQTVKFFLMLAMPVYTLAQSSYSITFVSPYGDDNNVVRSILGCSSVYSPCRTFQAAHDDTSPGGMIVVIDNETESTVGDYHRILAADYGLLKINKPITIDGGLGLGSEIAVPANRTGIFINSLNGARVTIRNLAIN